MEIAVASGAGTVGDGGGKEAFMTGRDRSSRARSSELATGQQARPKPDFRLTPDPQVDRLTSPVGQVTQCVVDKFVRLADSRSSPFRPSIHLNTETSKIRVEFLCHWAICREQSYWDYLIHLGLENKLEVRQKRRKRTLKRQRKVIRLEEQRR
jgi:hypothetical protein